MRSDNVLLYSVYSDLILILYLPHLMSFIGTGRPTVLRIFSSVEHRRGLMAGLSP